jgi:hypothetical protein
MPTDEDRGGSTEGSALSQLIQFFRETGPMLRKQPILLVGIAATLALVVLGLLGRGNTQPVAFSIAAVIIVAVAAWTWGQRKRLENIRRFGRDAEVEDAGQRIRAATGGIDARNRARFGRRAKVKDASQEIVIGPRGKETRREP